jgi:DNA-binding response OmpR family regulator
MQNKTSALTVLYVEDDAVVQENTAKTLHYFFSEVIVASDGFEALEILKTTKPDVLITDYVMPRMSGYELILEAQKIYPELIIFVTSSYREEDKLLKCIPLGLADYLLKPINYEKLVLAIDKVLEKSPLPKKAESIVLAENIIFNTHSQSLLVDGKAMFLSKQEVKLLSLFVKNRGNILSKNFMSSYLYGENVDENLLNNVIYRLRKKVGYDIFTTIKNLGYILR